ncbi:hypothetical protein BGZ83_005972 [Gryganskiella cystojenkinii]|nr:hypothetical protein BGZ83_005972 [Gryganskiella cystojenkinii]
MDNHDIRHQIGQYLDQKTALTCIRVSKDWHESFIPFVYNTVRLYFNEKNNRTARTDVAMPTVYQLERYGHYVRDLTLEGANAVVFQRAEKLAQVDRIGEHEEQDHPPHHWRWCVKFVEDHPRIERLKFCFFRHTEVLNKFVNIFTHLRALLLEDVITDYGIMIKILKRSPNLHTLSMKQGQISLSQDYWSRKRLGVLPQLRSLNLLRVYGVDLKILLEWMSCCPQLEEFRIHLCEPDRYGDWSLFSQCPNITRLTIVDARLIESTLASILTHCPKITELTLRRERVNEKAFKALRGLFGQLRVLNLFESVSVKSWMIGVILSDCPNLVEFSAGIVDVETTGLLTSNAPGRIPRNSWSDRDFKGVPISSRPWACTGLRRMRFKALDWSEEDAVNDKFLDRRLANLKALEEFSIGGFDEDEDDQERASAHSLMAHALAYTEHNGGPLEKGKFLREDLEREPSLQWMADTWPNLQKFKNTPCWRSDN